MSRHHFDAFRDLVRRYATVFGAVWRVRHEIDPKGFRAEEADFLPAALSLQERPVSPAPRWAMRLIVGFAVAALLWAIFGRMDIVATAVGKVVASDRTKIVQAQEAGKVSAIHVKNGDRVQAGQVLVELDGTIHVADQRQAAHELETAQWDLARTQSLLVALETGREPRWQAPEGAGAADSSPSRRLMLGMYAEYQAKVAQINAEVGRHAAERASLDEVIRKLESTLPIARQRDQDYEKLVEQNYVARHAFLERRQARLEMEADLATQRSRVLEIDAAIRERRETARSLHAEMRRSLLASADEASRKVAALQQELVKSDARSRTTRLVSPVSGTVQELAIHTVGGVVTPGQPLMAVVPADAAVEIEAMVENKDIGFVREGQVAEIKVETFPYTRYGTIDGTVAAVSNDAVQDEKLGLVYQARVHLARTMLAVDGKNVPLSPGMAVSAEVKLGTRRVIEYFLSPLLQYSRESLRER